MDVMVLEPIDDQAQLVPLLEEWQAMAGGYGVPLDINTTLGTMNAIMRDPSGSLLVLVDNGTLHGFMGILARPNHVGPGRLARECLFFITRQQRGHWRLLVNAAKEWAKLAGCSHLILTASRLANPAAERVGKVYQADGFDPFEASFIVEIA